MARVPARAFLLPGCAWEQPGVSLQCGGVISEIAHTMCSMAPLNPSSGLVVIYILDGLQRAFCGAFGRLPRAASIRRVTYPQAISRLPSATGRIGHLSPGCTRNTYSRGRGRDWHSGPAAEGRMVARLGTNQQGASLPNVLRAKDRFNLFAAGDLAHRQAALRLRPAAKRGRL